MNSEDRALLDNVVALEGKDLTRLTKEEKKIFDTFKAREHEFGIRVEVVSEAPLADVEQGTSPYLINGLEKAYPNQIVIIKE
ncbi:hypothetical protein [Photobacterium leiognathi]|uniref:hypothetical protein n=1 Tax=Photobacterium leiognathi TaxID=553611 RepID=UPI002734506D|nr:hypothetical protein [Photobacterium leiognathi]